MKSDLQTVNEGTGRLAAETIIDIAKRVLRAEAEAILALTERLGKDFDRAVDMLYNSRGRVVVTGMGKSGLIGKKIAATLASTGTPAFFLHPAEAGHGDLGMVTPEDVIIAISNSGETDELIQLLPYLKRFNVSIISLTGNHDSTLSRAADITIDVSVREEACPLGIVPTASTAAAMAMGDALAVALLMKRGFQASDFACLHPGGSLGKKLLITVKDLMHTGEALPVTSPETPMLQAIVDISSKRLGVTVITGFNQEILGIITDGDLRRGIEKWGKAFFDMRAGEVMTRNPRTIGEEELAAKALSVMERHSITALIVPDHDGRIRGIIHLHEILRKGIV
ncbi:MAG TPA: KpsF/GutQ family sugar-phosphate isomerase [Dissulfurispiraceae bacterium]|nr:KpsF/GutQ family sugar-phosphate isomerase [Dissulfurispiraceae bacterium]